MSDYPRRRRLEPEPPKRGGIPIIPLMILVVLCGLALGGLLTKFLGTGGAQAPTSAPSFTPLPEATATFTTAESPPPSPSPTPSAKTSPTAKASPTTKASPTAKASAIAQTSPSPSPSASTTASPTSKPKPKATQVVIVLTPTPAATHVASAPAATATASPPAVAAAPSATAVLITGANTSEHASAIVAAYVSALSRGDSSTAAGYLASGLPNETFINPNVDVALSQMRTARNTDGSYTVTAQIGTSKGTYLETFTLRMGPYGLQITEHSAQHI